MGLLSDQQACIIFQYVVKVTELCELEQPGTVDRVLGCIPPGLVINTASGM
jgi:hypothetical protein